MARISSLSVITFLDRALIGGLRWLSLSLRFADGRGQGAADQGRSAE
jgi:hypothetical protein